MNKFDELYSILNEQLNILADNYELEEEKYHVILKDDIEALNDIVQKEQAVYMKIRGTDNKREKTIKELGYSDKTLYQIIETMDDENKNRFSKLHSELNEVIDKFKCKNNECQELANIRIKRANDMIERIQDNSSNHIYDKSTNAENTSKNIFSRKI